MKIFQTLLVVLIPLTILFGGLELALRLFPHLIPLEVLQHFDENVRLDVAVKRDLPNRADVTAVERDDGGPLLRKYLPKVSVTQDFGDENATKTITTDNLGFCNPGKDAYDRESFDIIAIGDSLTWCTAVKPDETWPAFLGKELDQSIYNLGFPGIGLYEYLVLLRTYGLEKSPKIVVMNFTEGNDLRDALRYWRFKRRNTVDRAASDTPAESQSSFLGRISYSYNMVVGAYKELFQPRARDATSEGNVADARLVSIKKDDLNFRYRLNFDAQEIPFNTRNADRDELKHSIVVVEGLVAADIFDEALAEFKRLSEKHGFLALITYSPSAHVAYQKYAVYEESWVKPISESYSSHLRQLIAERAQAFDINFLDLTGPIRREIENQAADKPEKLLYYPGSIHYSIEGNRFIAREMADLLRQLTAPGSLGQ